MWQAAGGMSAPGGRGGAEEERVMLKRSALQAIAGLALVASVLAPGLAGTVQAAPDSQIVTNNALTIRLSPSTPNSFAVSGIVTNVPKNVESAVVTLTLN